MPPKHRVTWQTFEEMRKAAEEGDPVAQRYLGVCYQNGQGVPQDYHEAIKWFRRAAEQGHAAAPRPARAEGRTDVLRHRCEPARCLSSKIKRFFQ